MIQCMCAASVIVQITFRYSDLQNVIVSHHFTDFDVPFQVSVKYSDFLFQKISIFRVVVILIFLHQTVTLQHFILIVMRRKQLLEFDDNNGEICHFCQVHEDLLLIDNSIANLQSVWIFAPYERTSHPNKC